MKFSSSFRINIYYSIASFIIFNLLLSVFKNLEEKPQAVAATLEINKTVNNATPLSGETFYFTIQYSCASLTDDCLGTVITDPLPAELEFVSLSGSSHTVNETYNSGTHTVTFTFQNTLSAGSSGSVLIGARFPNGSTSNGATANNTATISSSNATSANSSSSVVASASAKIDYEKEVANGGVAGGNTTYQLMFCNTGSNQVENGTLNLENVTIVDTLPANTVYLEYGAGSGATGSYDASAHAVTFTLPTMVPGACNWVRVTVQNPSASFSLGDNITNTGYFNYTPIGESASTVSDVITHTLVAANPYADLSKTISSANPYQGQPGEYVIELDVDGTEPLNDFCIMDSIPTGFEISYIYKGGYYSAGLGISENILDIYYTTNLSGRTLMTGSPFSVWDPNNPINVETDLGLTIGGAEYITVLEFCFGDVPAGFSTYSDIRLHYNVMSSAPIGLATNCANMSTSSSPMTLNNDCVDATIQASAAGATIDPYVNVIGVSAGDYLNGGDTIEMQLRFKNGWISSDPITDPTMFNLLPQEGVYQEPGI